VQNFAPIGPRSSEITRGEKRKKNKPQQNLSPLPQAVAYGRTKRSQCEHMYDLIEEVHRLRMPATQPEEQQICDETDCIRIYKHLPKNTSPGPNGIPYEAFIYAGKDLIESTQRMFNIIWQMEEIPDQ